jgi:hypothetical protein
VVAVSVHRLKTTNNMHVAEIDETGGYKFEECIKDIF